MNILLVYPKFPDTFCSFSYALRFIGRKSAFPPLGLLTVAALLPEQFQIRLVDLNVDALGEGDLAWADMAFISAMAVQRKSTVHVIDRCKAKGLKVVAGGPLFTAQPYDFAQVDHLVLGEAEATLPAFLTDLKKGCVFFTEASINLADAPELMDMMAEAGFDSVFIGIETPDANSLTECCKTHNKNRDLLQDMKKIHRSGLQVMGGFIVGFDSDPPSIFQRQIDFIQQSGIVTAMVGMLQAPPGTRLFERLARQHRVSDAFSGDNVDGRTNIIPAMGLDRLIDLVTDSLRSFTPADPATAVETEFSSDPPPINGDRNQMQMALLAVLAAVYGIVKNHDGWISVASQWGAGTTVAVWLPAVLEFDEKMEKIGIDQNETTSVPHVDENKA